MADAAALLAICSDLAAEQEVLDALVAPLGGTEWDRSTPAQGWAVGDQISHLAYFDERALESIIEPEKFVADAEAMMAAGPAPMDLPVEIGRAMSRAEVLAWWRTGRAALLEAFAGLEPDARLQWYGPPMGAVSFVTARLMETWAHGQDVADALGVVRQATGRLRHVAHIGVGARAFSFFSRGLDLPDVPIRVELMGPDGQVWSWGSDDAADRVTGSALDFCLLVTQRRHLDDTDLDVGGPVATQWMQIAQAFAGPPGSGRRPGQFKHFSQFKHLGRR